MDYLKKIDEIIEVLIINDMNFEARKIQDIKKNAFTSTELLLSIGFELNQLIKDSKVNEVIGNDVNDLTKYCKKVGLLISKKPL